MENWGLITYRETAILYDSQETSTAAYQWVAIVIAHEIAHQVNCANNLLIIIFKNVVLVVWKFSNNEVVE